MKVRSRASNQCKFLKTRSYERIRWLAWRKYGSNIGRMVTASALWCVVFLQGPSFIHLTDACSYPLSEQRFKEELQVTQNETRDSTLQKTDDLLL